MDTSILDRLIKSVDVERNLLPFLGYSGWERVESENSRWIVMHGQQDIYNRPLELIFPQEKRTKERDVYILKAVELLTTLKDEPMQLVVHSIIKYDRDLLYVRNTEAKDENAISLRLAVNQINNLKKTVEYSTCSEKEAMPFFSRPNSTAQQMVHNFLFGHTVADSFGFTIEAPRLPDPPRFIQRTFFDDHHHEPLPTDIPLERRVVERIARGLLITQQAEQKRDHRILLQEYPSGFNSNMCSAVAGMSQEKRANIEYRIVWSPKIKPGEDIARIEPVNLRAEGYNLLKFAANELKSVEPDFVTITGNVRGLTTSDNPLRLETRRAIVIRGIPPGSKRAVDIITELEHDDYNKAIEAHKEWETVQVNGIMSRRGAGWRLLNARNFKVIEIG